jgi:hypothetical protein
VEAAVLVRLLLEKAHLLFRGYVRLFRGNNVRAGGV